MGAEAGRLREDACAAGRTVCRKHFLPDLTLGRVPVRRLPRVGLGIRLDT